MKSSKPQFDGQGVKLGDVATYINGYAFKPADYSLNGKQIIRIQDLTGNAYQTNNFAGELDDKYLVSSGDVLISWSASLGVFEWNKEEAWLNQHIFKVVFNKLPVDKRYFIHQARYVINKGAMLAHGATMRHLTKKVFESLPFSYPNRSEQLTIAKRLDDIQRQIYLAEKQISKLDSLVKSRFVEIFGDFACYETKPLIKCVDCIEAGKSPKCLAFSRKMAEPGVLKLSAISSGVYCENENKALPRSVSLTIDKVVHANDILLSRKNTPELVGRSVLVKHTDGNIMFPDIIFRMHPLPPINAMYLSYLLAGPLLHSIQSLAHGSAKSMSNIPKSELAKLSIPIPALNLQNEFANFVSQVDKSRFGGMLHLLNSLSGIMHASFFSVADTD